MPKAWRVWESSASYYRSVPFLHGKSSGLDSRVLTSVIAHCSPVSGLLNGRALSAAWAMGTSFLSFPAVPAPESVFLLNVCGSQVNHQLGPELKYFSPKGTGDHLSAADAWCGVSAPLDPPLNLCPVPLSTSPSLTLPKQVEAQTPCTVGLSFPLSISLYVWFDLQIYAFSEDSFLQFLGLWGA